MSRQARLVADDFNCLDAVQQALARRPELDFVDEAKELHPLAVVTFSRLFGRRLFSQSFVISIQTKLIGSKFSG